MSHDLVIIGGGPAGLTAAVYALRAGLKPLVLESIVPGGQMSQTPEIENYPGFAKTSGYELASLMESHARSLGASFLSSEATGIDTRDGQVRAVITASKRLETRAVIAAMGVTRRKLGCVGEDEFLGRGVSYCATCDGGFFKGRPVAVVGGGNTALEDALYLAGLGCEVRLVHRREGFRAGKALGDRVMASPHITMELGFTVDVIRGGVKVEALDITGGDTKKTLATDAVFIAVGVTPQTLLLEGIVPLARSGHAECGEDCRTPINGLFVAGDIRQKPLYQIVTACADGAVAAQNAAQYLEGL